MYHIALWRISLQHDINDIMSESKCLSLRESRKTGKVTEPTAWVLEWMSPCGCHHKVMWVWVWASHNTRRKGTQTQDPFLCYEHSSPRQASTEPDTALAIAAGSSRQGSHLTPWHHIAMTASKSHTYLPFMKVLRHLTTLPWWRTSSPTLRHVATLRWRSRWRLGQQWTQAGKWLCIGPKAMHPSHDDMMTWWHDDQAGLAAEACSSSWKQAVRKHFGKISRGDQDKSETSLSHQHHKVWRECYHHTIIITS